MKHRSNLLARASLAMLWTYGVLGGATGTGVLTPQYALMTLIAMALTVVAWGVIRWRRHWVWHRTAIDKPLILWGVAVVLSTVANLDSSPRIGIGLWFALAYLGLWYILQDAIANHGLDRETLVESLLLAGLVVTLFGAVQLGSWLANLSKSDVAFTAPRLTSTLDNPNALAAFLVIVIPLAAVRLAVTRHLAGRIFLTLYIALALVIEVFTFSRGAWIATCIALLALVVLILAHHNMLSAEKLIWWWRNRSRRVRITFGSAGVLIVVAGAVLAFTLLRSLTTPGRTLDLRTYIYDAAIQLFREKPLTGYGLFTFGRGLLRLASTPPYTPHNNAHNLPLNVAAELGIVGLLAFAVTVISVLRAIYHNWQTLNGRQRVLLCGAIAGSFGLLVDHMLDGPTSGWPILVIAWIVALSLATASDCSPPAPVWEKTIKFVLLAAMWVLLLGTGFRTVNTYTAYVAALQYGSQTGDYEGGAQRLQPVIDAEPSMPIYHLFQGYFLGVSAYGGNTGALPQAIAAYRRFCELEPYYAPAWANLGALYWQAGEREQAISAMERAVALAPQAWMLPFNLGLLYEAAGDTEKARKAYQETLVLYPDASLYPEWQHSELRRTLAAENRRLSISAQVVTLLAEGKTGDAVQLWEQAPDSQRTSTSGYVISEILSLEKGEQQTAEAQLAAAAKRSTMPQNDPWIRVGNARLARFKGDAATACQEVEMARALLITFPDTVDDRISAIAYNQFWKVGLPRYFLPQVYAPAGDAMLSPLLTDCQEATF